MNSISKVGSRSVLLNVHLLKKKISYIARDEYNSYVSDWGLDIIYSIEAGETAFKIKYEGRELGFVVTEEQFYDAYFLNGLDVEEFIAKEYCEEVFGKKVIKSENNT